MRQFQSECSTVAEEDIDTSVQQRFCQNEMSTTFKSLVGHSDFSIAIADPELEDVPLVAVSKKFEELTGYQQRELLGHKSCFLNQDAELPAGRTMFDLRVSCTTGAPFTGVLEGKRKSGEDFMYLLDLRGLSAAKHGISGEEKWFLIGIYADVTDLAEADIEITDDHLLAFNQMAKDVRKHLAVSFASMSMAGAAAVRRHMNLTDQERTWLDAWRLLRHPKWKQSMQMITSLQLDLKTLTLNSMMTTLSLLPVVSSTASSASSSRASSPAPSGEPQSPRRQMSMPYF